MDADSLSDGTLRVLALAAFLLTAPAGSLLVVEELDNGIHPSRARDLVAQTLDIARRRQVQILLTSHNPALLDALPYDVLPDVVCCYRDRTEGDSRLVRLGDLPKYPALMAQGSLGDLVTRQVIDRYLHDTRTAEEEKAAALSWQPAQAGLEEYLRDEVTGQPGQSMGEYWMETRGAAKG